MKTRIWTVVAGLAVVTALIAVPAAIAAYTTPKLEVTQAGQKTTFKITQTPSEDATASVRVFVPTGTTLTTNQPPGTILGKGSAILKLHALAGAEIPVNANVVVAAPGDVDPQSQQACLQGATPLATWLLKVTIVGTEIPVPVWLVPTSGPLTALGPAYIAACFSSPYIPETQGGDPGQPQVAAVEFSVEGVFSPVPLGAFVAILTPWTPGTATVNAAATVASPAAIAPGAVSIAAKRAGLGALVSGTVTQAGQGRGGAVVTIWAAKGKAKLKAMGKAKLAANGKYTFRARTGDRFQARVVAAAGSAPPLCTQLAPLQALGIKCVNPTVNGFAVQSKTVRKK